MQNQIRDSSQTIVKPDDTLELERCIFNRPRRGMPCFNLNPAFGSTEKLAGGGSRGMPERSFRKVYLSTLKMCGADTHAEFRVRIPLRRRLGMNAKTCPEILRKLMFLEGGKRNI
jgi:hypothetical protein